MFFLSSAILCSFTVDSCIMQYSSIHDGLCKSFTNLLAIFRNFQSKELHFLLLSIWYLELVDLFSFLGLQQFFPFVLMTSISDPLSTSSVPPPTPAPLTDSQSSAPIDVPVSFLHQITEKFDGNNLLL